MDRETEYLLTAIEKSGCVVVVRSYNNENNDIRKRLEYISENASDYGVNLNAIRQGYKILYIMKTEKLLLMRSEYHLKSVRTSLIR